MEPKAGIDSPSGQLRNRQIWRIRPGTEEVMLKRIVSLGLASAMMLASGYADQGKKVVIPVKHTDPTSGQQMYSSYCASCHGVDGRGNGSIAGQLQTRPTDLTTLSRNHNGKFPAQHVIVVLNFGSEYHPNQMPVWGQVLGNMSIVNRQQVRDLRVSNLTRYLQSIQVK